MSSFLEAKAEIQGIFVKRGNVDYAYLMENTEYSLRTIIDICEALVKTHKIEEIL